jgi:transcriptional regulator with XRE-family HTH domain
LLLPEIRQVLARQIRVRMASLRGSVTVVAARAGCSRGTLHAVLRGDVVVGITRVSALASALESTVAYLLDASLIPASLEPEQVIDIRLVLARNLIYWRARKSFDNLEALAQAASISKSHLYMIVKARCDTGIDHLAKLGNALEIPPAWLVSERNEHVDGG